MDEVRTDETSAVKGEDPVQDGERPDSTGAPPMPARRVSRYTPFEVGILVQALGGLDAVEAMFQRSVQKRVRAAMAEPGQTMRSLWQTAMAEGWLRALEECPLSELRGGTAPRGRKRSRVTQDELDRMILRCVALREGKCTLEELRGALAVQEVGERRIIQAVTRLWKAQRLELNGHFSSRACSFSIPRVDDVRAKEDGHAENA